MTNSDMRVSREWATRPNDQRFLSLQELSEFVHRRTDVSKVAVVENKALRVYGTEENELVVNTEIGPKMFTNWSFGQLASLVGAPGSYLKKLSSPLAAACINEGIDNREKAEIMVLAGLGADDTPVVRAFTGPTYGRIWDYQCVDNTIKFADPAVWGIPSSSYSTTNPLRATTLYASDRDVFIFLVDEKHPIDVDGRMMKRGFIVSNSETGSHLFWIAGFLYDTVCDNRIIWGISHKIEIQIRHCSGAPERFLTEGAKAIEEYSNSSAIPMIEQIKAAQSIKLGNDEDAVRDFLQKRSFTLATASRIIETSKAEGYDFYTAWGITQGITAQARSIPHTDTRIVMEKMAGKILDMTAGTIQ